MRLLLVLLLSAGPASAQMRGSAAPASAAAGASAAAAAPSFEAAPYVALRHELALGGAETPLNAGSAFLADSAALQWFQATRPERVPKLVAAALAMRDWEQLFAAHEDARTLRLALLARPDSPIAADPRKLLALVDRTPAYAADRRRFEEAVLDWRVFAPRTVEALTRCGIDEASWAAAPLAKRVEAMRALYQRFADAEITSGPGDPRYADQYAAALAILAPVLTNEELAGHLVRIERARRVAEGVERAKAATSQPARLAAYFAGLGDLDRAERDLGSVFAQLGLPAFEPAVPAFDLNAEERARLTRLLAERVLESMEGSALGAEVREAIGGETSIGIGEMNSENSIAHYRRDDATIVLGAAQLAAFAAELGFTTRRLLDDPEALADLAVIYGHIVVHEATHHRQFKRTEGLGSEARLAFYTLEHEKEANNAQAAFLRQKRASDPDFAAREARLRAMPGLIGRVMAQAENHAGDESAMNGWLARGYAHVPTLARAGSRLILDSLKSDARYAGQSAAIERELARRRRLPAVERLRLEQEGVDDAAPARKIKTSVLRRAAATMTGQAAIMVENVRLLAAVFNGEIERLSR